MKKLIILTVLVGIIAGAALSAAAADVKIGVLAKRGAPKCMKKWGATGQYLSDKLGVTVKIVPLKFEAIDPAVAAGKVDFVLANSAFYVQLEQKHGARAICTLINSRKGEALDTFGGVLFTKAGSGISSIEDVAGKRFMWVKESSFGGAQMAWRLLLANGVDPKRDCAEVLVGGKHDNVVLAVLNGSADVGTVRSDTIERMIDEGKLAAGDLSIINQVDDDFPFVHSTQLYPEWPMAAVAHTDAALADKVAAALMAMTVDSAAATAAKCVGWASPADYRSVEECLRTIGYGL